MNRDGTDDDLAFRFNVKRCWVPFDMDIAPAKRDGHFCLIAQITWSIGSGAKPTLGAHEVRGKKSTKPSDAKSYD
eukprot:1527596-Karenia_brevis.AAC.1